MEDNNTGNEGLGCLLALAFIADVIAMVAWEWRLSARGVDAWYTSGWAMACYVLFDLLVVIIVYLFVDFKE